MKTKKKKEKREKLIDSILDGNVIGFELIPLSKSIEDLLLSDTPKSILSPFTIDTQIKNYINSKGVFSFILDDFLPYAPNEYRDFIEDRVLTIKDVKEFLVDTVFFITKWHLKIVDKDTDNSFIAVIDYGPTIEAISQNVIVINKTILKAKVTSIKINRDYKVIDCDVEVI